jgi:hypothetical protein
LDPAAIGADQWKEIGSLLTNLWIVVFFIVVFAANLILGHNMVPSLLYTKDVPQIAQKARPVFYLFAVVSFAAAMVFLTMVIIEADVMQDFWADYWI